jgi:hypothetical protein
LAFFAASAVVVASPLESTSIPTSQKVSKIEYIGGINESLTYSPECPPVIRTIHPVRSGREVAGSKSESFAILKEYFKTNVLQEMELDSI